MREGVLNSVVRVTFDQPNKNTFKLPVTVRMLDSRMDPLLLTRNENITKIKS